MNDSYSVIFISNIRPPVCLRLASDDIIEYSAERRSISSVKFPILPKAHRESDIVERALAMSERVSDTERE